MAKISKQKKTTEDFFNKVSSEWFERTYDPSGKYLKFPVNKLRKDVALEEIDRLNLKKDSKFLDIGCGTGQMVLDLLERGYEAYGIDIASKMVEEANKNLANSNIKSTSYKVFETQDLSGIEKSKKYDFVTALGLLEYLDTDRELFSVLKNIVKSKGHVLVECRNEFFNLFTGNNYTLDIANKKQFGELLKEFLESAKYSPEDLNNLKTIGNAYSKVAGSLANLEIAKNSVSYSKYPSKMIRRQHTPQELERSASRYGFDLDYVVYYHIHPFPPHYEKFFPQAYNKISELMTPIGRTYLGASTGSAFVGVLKKK